jgi:hypothetical protein
LNLYDYLPKGKELNLTKLDYNMGKKSKTAALRRSERENNNLDPSVPRLPPKPKLEKYVNQGSNDLFEGALAKAAMAALSDEDKEKYRIVGEHLYGRLNFEDGTINNLSEEMAEAVAYLESQLNSGLHPSMLQENEKELLEEAYGEDWYIKWNYVKEDLEDIVTLSWHLQNN